jgi:hypothetical protein
VTNLLLAGLLSLVAPKVGMAATDSRLVDATWLMFGTVVALEREAPSQSWRWLNAHTDIGPEAAGTLLAYSIESFDRLTTLADDLHARNCASLMAQRPRLDAIAAAIERTNAELATFRAERVDGLRDVMGTEQLQMLMELVRTELIDAVEPYDLDALDYLEATGLEASELVAEMCEAE